MHYRQDFARLSMQLLLRRKAPLSYSEIYALMFWPMDSIRYFEFDFMLRALENLPFRRFLDVSSPRLLPVILLRKKNETIGDLINPDSSDLRNTARLIRAIGLDDRCRFHECLINSAPFGPGTFDVITSMSVVEHIPEDSQAIEQMWALLKPNGRLLLSVMCAAQAAEEFENRNEYGLLKPDKDGLYFFQRYYDQDLLQERVFSITGPPCRLAVYGEVEPGRYRRNEDSKISDPDYPMWRIPYMMGKDYRYFDNVNALPGVGVIGMEFIKA